MNARITLSKEQIERIITRFSQVSELEIDGEILKVMKKKLIDLEG